nr:hypothetical protein [Escherichia coli]
MPSHMTRNLNHTALPREWHGPASPSFVHHPGVSQRPHL